MNFVTLLMVGVGAVLAFGLGALLLGLRRAPDGFQDDTGFHLGTEAGTKGELVSAHAGQASSIGRAA